MPGVEEYLRVGYLSSSAPEEKLLCLEWKNISECATSAPQPLRRTFYAWSGKTSQNVLPQLLSP